MRQEAKPVEEGKASSSNKKISQKISLESMHVISLLVQFIRAKYLKYFNYYLQQD